MSVIRLAPVVTHRCCPDCGWMLSQAQVDAARFNFKCPNLACDKRLSDFKPIDAPWAKRGRP